jgi:protein involved in polysaccharide export with SLBB domain
LTLGLVAYAQVPVTNYVIGPEDVLTITSFDQDDITGKYQVDADGTFSFPLIGRVHAGGLTLRQLQAELVKRLKEGFFKDPQIGVAVEQYRSQKFHIVGEVRTPGTYPLTGDMNLMEALARAGSATPTAAGEVLIVRAKTQDAADGPTLPNRDDVDVTTIELKALQSGRLAQKFALRDGDTIVVPRAESVYVFGQVRNPGAYPGRKTRPSCRRCRWRRSHRSRRHGAYQDRADDRRQAGGDQGEAGRPRAAARHHHGAGAVFLTVIERDQRTEPRNFPAGFRR